MKLFKLSFVFMILISFISCNHSKKDLDTGIIPKPQSLQKKEGVFHISSQTSILAQTAIQKRAALQLIQLLDNQTGIIPKITENKANDNQIQFSKDSSIKTKEGYKLDIENDLIVISAVDYAGYFYGVQSIRALLPASIEAKNPQVKSFDLPALSIQDAPRFAWRGMMLDCSRHFFPVDYIKKNIDRMARLKMNVFHWHLIDDQGWRIEIKKYPKLTEISSWRPDYEDRDWGARPTEDRQDGKKYGGFYTQEQIKEIVKYAEDRNITVVPEIEMPAHVTALFAAYPEFSCRGKKLAVPTGSLWPITDIYCAGKDETFHFIEDVLTEVMQLFPSKYIHIGGDEADKKEWEHCKDCQRRIKKEKLKNVHELQSYFIERVEKFLNKNGRELIGWDEILEGGLAPNAAVMSWRGMNGGVKAAKMHHPVVMTPTQHCYFDYYQGPRDLEPTAFGANLPIKKVYDFNPIPKELNSKESKFIMGVQANLWTEHVPNASHAEYMTFPRLAAMSEVAWTNQENRNWEDFQHRMQKEYQRYKEAGINFAKSAFNIDIKTKYDTKAKKNFIHLSAASLDGEIFYTTDGSEPNEQSNKFTHDISVDKTTTIKAIQIKDGIAISKTTTGKVYVHKASDSKVTYKFAPSSKYPDKGNHLLTNCTMGTQTFTDGQWAGFEGTDMDVILDMGKMKDISSFQSHHLYSPGSWIFLPKAVSYSYSTDGKEYHKLGTIKNPFSVENMPTYYDYPLELKKPVKARYLHVIAHTIGNCPDWHGGKGLPSWLFADEIIIK
ncbi:family 20 glycosylhydrolase [Halosquirtibacter laminarini]|uniref:Family 20 glycosylhydrolase n=1 Tax=Halosquirtibacter laminarini TaxID=3374600 RepID=A0AC61NIW5_9BACT|nr:family 20 glycosylhydrolase [Prolixibacteraceae bacterium]